MRTRKLSKKGYKKDKKEDSSPRKKDLSKVKCFRCHQLGHYAKQCLKKTGKAKQKQVVARTIAGVDESSS
jgi:hypothetical protein